MGPDQRPQAWKISIAILVTVVFLITSISSIALGTKATEEKTFVIGMTETVSSANPFIGIYDADYMVYWWVYEYLFGWDDYGNSKPNLATSWWYMNGTTANLTDPHTDLLNRDPSEWPMGSIWEYNLTDGIYWSDGVHFDADDVVYTIELQIGANYASFWAFQPYTKYIDHVQKVNQYKVRFFFADRTNATNPAVSVVFGDNLWIPIMPKHVLEGYSPGVIAQSWNGIPTVGTGPFIGTDAMEDEVIGKEKLTLVRNPEWDSGLARLYNRTCDADKIVMKFYSDEPELMLDLQTMKIDAAEITPIDYLSLKNATDKPPQLKVYSKLQAGIYTKISHFNSQIGSPAIGSLNPARVDPALHRATAIATDRDQIVTEIFRGLGVKGVGILTPASLHWYYDAYSDTKNRSWFNVSDASGATLYSYNDTIAHVMDFNITRANEILNASGYPWPTYPNGYRQIGDVAAERLLELGVVGNIESAKVDSEGNPRYLEFEDIVEESYDQDMAISDYLSSAWKSIGVKLTKSPVSAAAWGAMVYGFQDEFTETYWSGDFDPNYLLYVPSSYSMDGWNEWGKPAPWYDYCYSMQVKEFNKTKREYWVHECEKYLFLSGAAFLTTCNPNGCYAYLDYRWTDWYEAGWTPGYEATDVTWVGENPSNNSSAIIIMGAIAAIVAAATAIIVVKRYRKDKLLVETDYSGRSQEELDRVSRGALEKTRPTAESDEDIARKAEEIVIPYEGPEENP